MKKIITGVLTLLIIMIIASAGMGQVTTMPDNAIVYVDDTKKTYCAPTYLSDQGISSSNLKTMTSKDAEIKGYEPDEECKNLGYFMQDTGSVLTNSLRKVNILPEIKSRWEKDGQWNW